MVQVGQVIQCNALNLLLLESGQAATHKVLVPGLDISGEIEGAQ